MRLTLGIGLVLLLTTCGGESNEPGIDILVVQDTASDAQAETTEDSADTTPPTPDVEDIAEEDPCLTTNCSARINAVYIAQNHVLRPNAPYFSLVSQRPALLKVVVTTSDSKDSKAPPVTVTLTRKGKTEELTLAGPTTLVTEIDLEPGKVEHKYANSFTVMIPKKWVQPGLELTVTAGTSEKEFTELKIGAPNRLYMTMFDVHFWGYSEAHTSDYSTGWESELEAKLPISELVVERIPHISFEQVVTTPREDSEIAATLASSVKDYKEKTGADYDGEQAVALLWKDALQNAGGQKKLSLYFVNIINSKAKTLGGQGGGFSGVGSMIDGVFFHELGHALSLPHWGEVEDYPYQGDMHGILVGGDTENNQHVGPTWGFDQREGSTVTGYSFPYFISPVVQP
ncbi:MAG TPA: hypothetical protein EYN06_07460, partial [Myxococcales bacterium]|nr:hypothetical protein [Myxococcales bacterium]